MTPKPKRSRYQIIAILTVLFGLGFLYQPDSVLLKGIALPLLTIASIISARIFSAKWVVETISGLGLVTGLVFLFLNVPGIVRDSAFHLIFASAIAFGLTTRWRKQATVLGGTILVIGFVFLYQPLSFLRSTALYLILVGMTLFAILSNRKWWVERISISAIACGLIFLCQPFREVLFQTGFQILLGGLTGFIIVAHR